VILGVVDPGVGSARDGVVMRADGRWFVGPDNGLFSVVAGRSASRSLWRLASVPEDAAPSFHGRDVFAPLAAAVATDDFPNESVETAQRLEVALPHDDVAEVIYVDHYGNAFTGLRAGSADHSAGIAVGGRLLRHARVFSDVAQGEAFWYANSIGLVALAVNGGSCAARLGIALGTPVAWTSQADAAG
jgi:S-adenosylmethionine hydrolase